MLSALIRAERSYPAMPLAGTTGTLEVRPPRSSRTRGEFPQHSTPTADRRPTIMLLSRRIVRTDTHFCASPRIATGFGLYLSVN